MNLIKNSFTSITAIINLSALIFGLGHIASVIGTGDIIATILQIINAYFFGIVSTETLLLTKSIYPLMAFHFIYNTANYISTANGTTEIICIGVQVALTVITAVIFGINIKNSLKNEVDLSDG